VDSAPKRLFVSRGAGIPETAHNAAEHGGYERN
jgi:hypothetical protein